MTKRWIAPALGAAVLIVAGLTVAEAEQPPMSSAIAPKATSVAAFKFEKGYLAPSTLPDSVALLPPPPAAGSAAEASDVEASKAALALHGGPRWTLATVDADLFTPRATATMACSAGHAIGPMQTPLTEHLLRRALTDLAASTRAAKAKFQRERPFMANGQPMCTPDLDAVLRHDGSYPSGHSAIGYGWGLILAEIVPSRATALAARGRAFGDSRRVCNVHWLSDVEEGRIAAAATLARMHAEPAFQADLAAAAKELAADHSTPTGCDAEAAALALH
ncbi:MAG: phosphatase PAP2 family protein [Novosphingobium sp.]